jgi:hypothetical protein
MQELVNNINLILIGTGKLSHQYPVTFNPPMRLLN